MSTPTEMLLASVKELQQHIVHDDEGDLTREEFSAMCARADEAIAASERAGPEVAPADGEHYAMVSYPDEPSALGREVFKDAARYRWLRSREGGTVCGVNALVTPRAFLLNHEDLDRAVDEAMAQEARLEDAIDASAKAEAGKP